jgi:hypothetical protein
MNKHGTIMDEIKYTHLIATRYIASKTKELIIWERWHYNPNVAIRSKRINKIYRPEEHHIFIWIYWQKMYDDILKAKEFYSEIYEL